MYTSASFNSTMSSMSINKVHYTQNKTIWQEKTYGNSIYIAKIFEAVAEIAKQENLENGYRVVNNCGKDGGQTVGHIHFHLLARRNLAWPPG